MRRCFARTIVAAAIGAIPLGTVTCNVPDSIVFYGPYDVYDDHHHGGFFDVVVDVYEDDFFGGTVYYDEYY